MFSRRVPLVELVEFCRVLRHNLSAGLSLVQVLRQQAARGPRAVRPLAGRLSEQLQMGSGLADALDAETDAFPPLFLAMVRVGEETGNLPEVLHELERYFQLELQLRRQFRTQLIPTAVQFGFAVLILAGLIFILGLIAPPGRPPLFTFFGLGGAAGALAFLALVVGLLIGGWLLVTLLGRLMRQRASVDRLLLRVPVLGPCLRALAQSRFTLALQLTLDSGLPIVKGLRLSLQASGNAAYADRAAVVTAALKRGETLYQALTASGLFSDEFLSVIDSAEAGGRVPEMMRHQAEQYQEEASRRLTTLTRAATGLVWLAYAGFMIWAIFRVAGIYFGALSGRL